MQYQFSTRNVDGWRSTEIEKPYFANPEDLWFPTIEDGQKIQTDGVTIKRTGITVYVYNNANNWITTNKYTDVYSIINDTDINDLIDLEII